MIHVDQLRSLIVEAFLAIPHPGRDKITEHQCEECDQLRDTFAPLRWESALPEIIDSNFGQLPLFTPEAYRYYLPAYLLRSLDNFDPLDNVCEYVIYSLTPDCSEDFTFRWYSERVKLFSHSQKAAVAAFLEFFLASDKFRTYHIDIMDGLKRFWSI